MRTLYSGISSGTEMLAYRGEIDGSVPLDEKIGALGGTFTYPFEYGYSAVGAVERAVAGFSEGDVVFSFEPHRSHFQSRPDDLIPLGGLEPRVATLFPLVETALQISLDAADVSGRVVVVIGLGAVGILSAALIARIGADVLGVEPLAWRREAASAFGFRSVDPDGARDAVADLTHDEGAHVVVEVSGNPIALADSLSLLGHEGLALVCSWFGSKRVSLPLGEDFHRRRLTIKSSQVSTIPRHLQSEWTITRRREVALQLMHQLPLQDLATHTFPVEDAAEAFAAIDSGAEGLIHAALSYG